MPRLRPVPMLALLELAVIARDHWNRLDDHDRRELARIVGKSKGRPRNLSPEEKRELRRLLTRLDLVGAGRRLMPLGGRLRGRRR